MKGRHRHKLIDRNDHSERFPTFFNGEDISGRVELRIQSKILKHKGIRAELHGIIEKYGNIKKTKTFLNMNTDLCPPGEITQEKIMFEFNFQDVKMPYESYKGDYASVKYFIRIVIISTVKNTEFEKEFAVVNPYDNSILQKNDEPIKMQVGMKNKLSLAIYFQHKNYNCRGTLKGFIEFNFLNINLKFMEVQIVRREIIFGDKKCEPAYVARYELIDGVPNKNEKIPIRFFLKSYNLTPTYPNIDNVFFVKYYLNLVIADEEDNRYFKQKEICLFRLYKERRNIYNPNKNNANNYNYMNEYGEFDDNEEIFITEPIYEEDYFMDNKQIQNYDEQQDNNYGQNEELYNDIKGMNPILPNNNDYNPYENDNRRKNESKNNNQNSQDNKRNEFKEDNYNLLVMYMNNKDKDVSANNNYDDFENMGNNNKFMNKNKNINNNYNKNQNNNRKPNNNKSNNNYNKRKNEIIINNNPSNYHSIKSKNTENTYDENKMFEEEDDMNYDNQNNINNINEDNNNININNENNQNSINNYNDDFNENNNINNENNIINNENNGINNENININDEKDINQNQTENQNEVHRSRRNNLMQARISSEEDFKDIFNSLETNKNKEDLKKNIFG